MRLQGSRIGLALAAGAFLAFFLGPVAWQVLTSVWPPGELLRPWPGALTLESHAAVLRERDFGRAVWNSVLVASGTTALCLAAASPAAFALARLRLRGSSLLLGAALVASMFPPIATASPLYVALRALGLLDGLAGLVLSHATLGLPLALWLLTAAFREIPDELHQAARVDGCGPIQAFWRVLLPAAAPGVATAAILVFVTSWNEFLYALTFLSTPSRRTVPVAIGLFAGEHVEPWGEIAAASVQAALPVAVATAFIQRRIAAGLTAGALKG